MRKTLLAKNGPARSPRGKKNERAYAIGDIHGCLKETEALLQAIKRDSDYRSPCDTHLIFLGDLIDRGPNSKGVIELLIGFPYTFASPLFIMGNHEEMMVRGLTGEPHLLPDWLDYGGYACAQSYGLAKSHLQGQPPQALEYQLRSAIPKEHIDFLSGFLDYVMFGDYVFTHAGIRPGIPLTKQDNRTFRWIREPFLDYNGDHGFVVVHGHTVEKEVTVKANRIGLDTGAYKTGKLSAICIEEDDLSFISTC